MNMGPADKAATQSHLFLSVADGHWLLQKAALLCVYSKAALKCCCTGWAQAQAVCLVETQESLVASLTVV